jgi:hydrogenase-4 component H
MSSEFETSTNDAGDARQRLEIFMSTCQRCGRCFKDESALEKLKMTGYRFDDLASQRWVFASRAYQEEEPPVKDIAIEMDW